MDSVLRRFVILGTPLVLGALLITHPVLIARHVIPTGGFSQLLPQADWWLTVHMLYLPLFCLIGLAAFLLLDGVRGVAATISRVALAVFVIFYPAFDAVFGIGAGILGHYAAGASADQQAILSKVFDTFLLSPVTNLIALLGEVGWEVAMLTAVLAFARPSRSRLLFTFLVLAAMVFGVWSLLTGFVALRPLWIWWVAIVVVSILLSLAARPHLLVGLLALAAFLFGTSHAPPIGPLGMACFFLAALQYELLQRKRASDESVTQVDTAGAVGVSRVSQ